MPKIVKLDEQVINQIAAGEVVENPASIVKELIENSLDAGARRISVHMERGGQLSIEVEDDGCGMGPEDAVLSLERHATSKIQEASDLSSLETFGFRGEALAAIASISKLELKTFDGCTGTRLIAEGGVIESISPCARNRGTTLSVRSVFYNAPARKKFQKSAAANTAQVRRVVETAAMAHPEVAFFLTSGKETLLQVNPQGKKQRIETLLGPFAHELQTTTMWGLLSAPLAAKSHRREQYLFINGRPVTSPLISKAVQAGYATRLAESRYPPFVLFLSIDPGQIDVNVHPQKKEVRFSDESVLFRQVASTVASVFEVTSFDQALHFDPPPAFRFEESSLPLYSTAPKAFPQAAELIDFEIADRALAVWEKYLLIETNGLFLVDLKRASARVLFESMQKKAGARQELLIPIEIDRVDEEMYALLQAMDVDCRWIGSKRVAIDAIDTHIEPSEFLDFYEAYKKEKSLEKATAYFSAQGKQRYNLDEATLVWKELQKCSDRSYDPVGKPIVKEIKAGDFERWLDRG